MRAGVERGTVAWAWAWVWGAAAVVIALGTALPPWGPHMVDLTVYRLGADALLHGVSPYSVAEPAFGLPFTYPAFAALVFVPYALLPFVVAKIVVVLVTLASLWVVAYLTLDRIASAAVARRWAPLVALVATTAHPVLDTLLFGQVNVALTALVMVDVLVIRGRWRGVLTGLATGVKLTSGLFIVYFLVTRQVKAAARAAGTFAATVALGFAIAPRGAWEFWTALMFDAHRVGTVEYVTNQSLLGLITRLIRHPDPPSVLTLGASLVAAGVALWLAARTRDELLATCLVGTGALLASPISWSHHWIWIIPALGLLARWANDGGARGRRWWAGPRWWVTGLAAAVLWSGPMRFVPNNHGAEFVHTLPQQIVANCYVALAVAFLAWAAAATPRVDHDSQVMIDASERRQAHDRPYGHGGEAGGLG